MDARRGFAALATMLLLSCGTLRTEAPAPIVIRASVDSMALNGCEITISDRGLLHEHCYHLGDGPPRREWERTISAAQSQELINVIDAQHFRDLTDESVWVDSIITDEPDYSIEVSLRGERHRVQAHALFRAETPQLARFRNVWNAIVALAPHAPG